MALGDASAALEHHRRTVGSANLFPCPGNDRRAWPIVPTPMRSSWLRPGGAIGRRCGADRRETGGRSLFRRGPPEPALWLPCPFGWDPPSGGHAGRCRYIRNGRAVDGETTNRSGRPHLGELYCGCGSNGPSNWATVLASCWEGTPIVDDGVANGYDPLASTELYRVCAFESLTSTVPASCAIPFLAKDLVAGGATGQLQSRRLRSKPPAREPTFP